MIIACLAALLASCVVDESSTGLKFKNIDGFVFWDVYHGPFGSSTVPEQGRLEFIPEGDEYRVEMQCTLPPGPVAVDVGEPQWPFSGIMTYFNEDVVPEDVTGVNGVTVTYRASSSLRFKLATGGLADTGLEHQVELDPSGSYTTITIDIGDFVQPMAAAGPMEMALDLTQLIKIQFEPMLGEEGGSADIAINQLLLHGYNPNPL